MAMTLEVDAQISNAATVAMNDALDNMAAPKRSSPRTLMVSHEGALSRIADQQSDGVETSVKFVTRRASDAADHLTTGGGGMFTR